MTTVAQTASLTGIALLGLYSLHTANIPALLMLALIGLWAVVRADR